MTKLTTKAYPDYYIVSGPDLKCHYMITKDRKGWHVLSEVTGEPSFWVSTFPTKRRALNAIIDHN